jgi:diguanylate cyclase (GGDEF)-like protein
LRTSLEHEKELARTDPLTGAVNSRQFQELIRIETERLHRYRHPFTLVYMDLDNFKYMNDRFGHAAGDRLLREIVNYSQENLRSTDAVARLGGDEFAYLLPETDQVAAQMVVRKIQSGLLKEMQKNKWPVTLSIGVLTCTESMDVVDQIISTADRLMYAVKRGGKNSVNYFVHEGMYVTDSPKPGTDENPGDGND